MRILSKEERYLIEQGLALQIKTAREFKVIAELTDSLSEYTRYKTLEDKLTALRERIIQPHVRVAIEKVK